MAFPESLSSGDDATLARLAVDVSLDTGGGICRAATIRPTIASATGVQIATGRITCAGVLKYRDFPLAELLWEMLEIGRQGMG